MIQLPKQTDSKVKSLRGWGCYFHCIVAMVADKYKRVFSASEIASIFELAIMNGYVIDNDLPTDGSKGNWYRSFVRDPRRLVNLIGDVIGHSIIGNEVYRDNVIRTTDVDYIVVEYQTPSGSHFVVRKPHDAASYDPGPNFARLGIKSYRGWKILDNK